MTQPSTPEFRAAMADLGRGAAAAAIVGFFVNLLHLGLPLYTIQIYDRVISSGSIDTLVALTILVVIVLGFQAVLDVMRTRIFTIVAARTAARLGPSVLEAAVETTLRQGPAAAGNAVRDVGDLRTFIASGAVALPLDLAVTPIFLIVLFLMHPIYGIIGAIGAFLLAITALATEILARRPAARSTAASGAVQAETAAAIRNAEVITAMGMLPVVIDRWRAAQARSLEHMEAGRSVAKSLGAVAKMLRVGLQIATVCTGAILVINREASAGSIIASTVLSARLLHPFEHLVGGWRQWVDAIGAFGRTRDLLVRGATHRSRVPVQLAAAALTVDRVSYMPHPGEAPLLRNISFRAEAGEFIGVVGPSGAGKSTLARLVVGLWAPTAGGIYLDGQSTFAHERSSFGEAVGYLPQDPMLFDGKVRENIARFRGGDMAAVVAAARAAGVHELIGRLPQGYETELAAGGGRLSGGQRQRIALARALYGDPKLIVLDEPNSSLDAEGEAALISAMEGARARGAIVFVVAQRMSILNRADRLIVLKEGAMTQVGDRAEVLATLAPRRGASAALHKEPAMAALPREASQ